MMKTLLVNFLLIFSMTSCLTNKISTDSESSSPVINIVGSVTLGAVKNSTVNVYELKSDGTPGELIAETMTDTNGLFFVDIIEGSSIIAVARGGSYLDEATGESVFIGDATIEAVVTVNNLTEHLAISAVSHIVSQRAQEILNNGAAPSLAIIKAKNEVFKLLGVKADILNVQPFDLTNAPSVNNINNNIIATTAGVINASISEYINLKRLEASELIATIGLFARDYRDQIVDGKEYGTPLSTSTKTENRVSLNEFLYSIQSIVEIFLKSPENVNNVTIASITDTLIEPNAISLNPPGRGQIRAKGNFALSYVNYSVKPTSAATTNVAGGTVIASTSITGSVQIGTIRETASLSGYDTDVQSKPSLLASADLNGDGFKDLVISSNWDTAEVTVKLSNGSAGLGKAIMYKTKGTNNYDVKLADFNNDGFIDAAVGFGLFDGSNVNGVTIFVNNGKGAFDKQYDITFPKSTTGWNTTLAIADFDQDGCLDITTSDYTANKLFVFYVDCSSSFPGNDIVMVDGNVSSTKSGYANVTKGIFNNDDFIDIAVINDNNNSIEIFFNDGKGNFSLKNSSFFTVKSADDIGWAIDSADFNGDGIDDIVVLDWGINAAFYIENDGNGNLTTELELNSAYGGVIYAQDINGDG